MPYYEHRQETLQEIKIHKEGEKDLNPHSVQ